MMLTRTKKLRSEYPSEDEQLERTRSKKKKCGPSVGKTKEDALDAEGISQISESSCKSDTISLDGYPRNGQSGNGTGNGAVLPKNGTIPIQCQISSEDQNSSRSE